MSYFSPSKEEKVRFNPVLVRRLNNEFGTAKVIFEAGRDSVFAEWIPRENLKEPLIIILDFSLDVRETLLAISHNIADLHIQSSQWLDGKSLINLDIKMVRQTIDLVGPKGWILHAVFKDIQVKEKTLDRAMSRLEELEPTLFLIDFSQIKPDEVFLNRSEGTNSNLSSLSKGLSDFCQWVASHKHRVILGLPRFLLAQPDFGNLVQNISRSWSFISAELFSHEHRWRADYCQELLRDIPLPNILRALVSANSNALSHAVVCYILESKRSGTLLPARADDFSGLVTLINLAKNLIDDGFYEIAYRIELYCRSLEAKNKYIVRTAVVFWKPKGTVNTVVGFFEDAAEAPQATSKAILTGEAGIGKTTLLRQIEHKWSIPQVAEKGKIASWLPISVSLASRGDNLEEKLRQNWYSSFRIPNTDVDKTMSCHSMIKDRVPSKSLKWLFSSPILLLVDGLDEVSDKLSANFSSELSADIWKFGFSLFTKMPKNVIDIRGYA